MIFSKIPALLSCYRRNQEQENSKLLWTILILHFSSLCFLLIFLFARQKSGNFNFIYMSYPTYLGKYLPTKDEYTQYLLLTIKLQTKIYIIQYIFSNTPLMFSNAFPSVFELRWNVVLIMYNIHNPFVFRNYECFGDIFHASQNNLARMTPFLLIEIKL